jgi:hypothetical protein
MLVLVLVLVIVLVLVLVVLVVPGVIKAIKVIKAFPRWVLQWWVQLCSAGSS